LAPASIPPEVKEVSAPAAAVSVSGKVSTLPLPTAEAASLVVGSQFVAGGGLPEIISRPSESTMFDVADLFDFDYPSTVTDQAVVSAGHSGGGDTQALPRYTENPRPRYPAVARRKGWSGIVEIGVRVNTSGRVVKLSIVQSSGFSVLDRAARRAVRLWQFVPATRLGHNVAADVVVPIDFRLPEAGGEQGLVAE
ncbi:MAG: energy transducer TonB, partial [Geopsychrobacter sp.]|nr:energy transducer TonB [Geopsychrobacter sp.]